MILSITLNASVDRSVFVEHLKIGDTNRVVRTATDAGGKGVNMARVIAELGGEALATGFLGGGTGAYVLKVLEMQGVKSDFVQVRGETRINFTVEDESDAPPTTFNERGPQISEQEYKGLLSKCRELGSCCTWAALGGSLPPGVPTDAFAQFARLLKDQGTRVVLDADGEAMKFGLQEKVDFIKPNVKEAERLLGRSIENDAQAAEAARELYDRDIPVVVISQGDAGAMLCCEEGLFKGISPPVDVHSTIGSGDSLIGGMLWSRTQGSSWEEAFRWGVAAGAATATTDGSEIARRPVMLEIIEGVQVFPFRS